MKTFKAIITLSMIALSRINVLWVSFTIEGRISLSLFAIVFVINLKTTLPKLIGLNSFT